MRNLFDGAYDGKRAFVTGDTGFKGSWLALWLQELGAEVTGYALDPPSEPNHFDALALDYESIRGDVRDRETLTASIERAKPEVVFHLAAQPLVRRSYREPTETFETNVTGVMNVLEACRRAPSVRAVVIITSDKCYRNVEWEWGYRETDELGGRDPYSASKGAAELIVRSYRASFFDDDDSALVASARAGNVVGGGDWAEDRLIPDLMRAAASGEPVEIRRPNATRPWQHVLEPLSGYLLLGAKLLAGERRFADGWNFAPHGHVVAPVSKVVERAKQVWDKFEYRIVPDETLHEDTLLKLDSSKAHLRLGWGETWTIDETFEATVGWYRDFYETPGGTRERSLKDLNRYVEDAEARNVAWAT
jgi:CDP-glucose 4,6-dehydratase